MNRLILLIILCIGLAQQMIAQQKGFNGGVFLNFNGIEFKGSEANFWHSSTSEKIDGTLGSSVGLFVKREFSRNSYAAIELRYMEKGSIYEFISQYGTQAFETLNLDYIEIPFLFGYKIKPFKRQFYCEFGFAYAKLISSNIKNNDLTTRMGTPNANDFKNYDLSWIADLKFPLVKKWERHVLFGLRMSRSILSIHRYYKIYNFDYGLELNYIFNRI
jgi:hypothetical protein